jgi:hypothetical protein
MNALMIPIGAINQARKKKYILTIQSRKQLKYSFKTNEMKILFKTCG